MYFPTLIELTMIFASNLPLSYFPFRNLTPQRKEVDSPFTYVYTAKYENQYSVILLNCHSTPLTVTVFPTFPSNLGFHSNPNVLQRSFSQSDDGATDRDSDLACCNAHLFDCVDCFPRDRDFPAVFSHAEQQNAISRNVTHSAHRYYLGDHCDHETGFFFTANRGYLVHFKQQRHSYLFFFFFIKNVLSPDPAISCINSFVTRCVDSLLLVTMFLMSCGWQITHQLVVVGTIASCDVGKRNPVWIVHFCRAADFERGFFVL